MNDKRILIGEITTVHGIKGFVKIRSYVDDSSLLEHRQVQDEKAHPVRVQLKHANKEDWIAQINDIDDRTKAEGLRGTKLYLPRSAMPNTEDGEFYIEDLKGLRAINENGQEVGTIQSVENYGAGDLLDIKPATGGNFYLPFTDDMVVDLTQGTISFITPEVLE